MTSCDLLDNQRLERFERLLCANPSTRVRSETLWHAFAQVFPHRAAGPAERRLLLTVLAAVEGRGLLRLPPARGTRWDRSMDPAVPRSVDLVRAQPEPPSFSWRTFPWHADLKWVARCRTLSVQQLAFLQRVHDGLVHGLFREPAPLKYRSLQLTGDEKRLALLATTSLFGNGQLSLETLGCLPDALPLAWEAIGEGGRMVIFENAGPFAVARRVLSDLATRPYDLVAYGGGRSILAALGHIKSLERTVSSLHYVGDIDDAGLDIAWNARHCAARLGLPAIQPATEVHRQMLATAHAFGYPDGWPTDERVTRPDRLRALDVLAPEVRLHADRILQAGRRIPEEVLGPVELRAAWSA